MKVRRREESEVVEEGINVTESPSAWYVYVKQDGVLTSLRLPKTGGDFTHWVDPRDPSKYFTSKEGWTPYA